MTVEFVTSTENVSDLFSLLKPLGSKVGNCIISEDGLQFTVEIDKILLIQTWVPAHIFSEWNYLDLEFSIDIGLLLESLAVFGMEKSLEIQSKADELLLSSKTDDAVTRISLKKYEKTSHCGLSSVFGELDILAKIIIKSSELSLVIGDLDASCSVVAFDISNTGLLISSIGSFGETEIKFERDSNAFDSFEFFGNDHVSASYNFSLFKHSTKALATSRKTCIRINQDGILSLQFMIPILNESRFSFIEFAVISIN